jgi:rfaE bifunctional protein nucleotidyltransferase chain/domain
MKQAIFLDRDGTLNVDNGYTYKLEDFKLHDGVIEGLTLLKKEFLFFIVTNQSGIGRGYYSLEQAKAFNKRLTSTLREKGIVIEEVLICPHLPEEPCSCRKPNTASLLPLVKKYSIDLSNSWVIGDHPCDIQLAKNLKCKSVCLLTGHGVKHLEDSRKLSPEYVSANFSNAAKYILQDESKIVSRQSLGKIVERLKSEGKKIVSTNGTFDILHSGHEKFLSEAKAQGDILIVGVNSDSSVKKNKGPTRPINNEISRAKMIASFDCVDYVTLFEETVPMPLLEVIKPHVHVNGSEYGENCIEAETVKRNGGKIYIVKLVEGISTTNILKGTP